MNTTTKNETRKGINTSELGNAIKALDKLLTPPTTTTKVVKAKKVTKVEKITYLNVGVTGKQMMKAIYKANNAHKKDMGSFSQCLKRALEFGSAEFSKTIKGFDVKDCTPKNLIPLRNVKRGVDASFSVYEVLMLIKKYYQTK